MFLPVVTRLAEYVTPHSVRSGVEQFLRQPRRRARPAEQPRPIEGQGDGNHRAVACSTPPSVCSACGTPVTRMASHKRSEDFGQTLGFSGVGSGPYLVLPIPRPVQPARHRRTGGGLRRRIPGELPQRSPGQRRPPGDHRPARGGQALQHQLPATAR
ncbi:MlaA family lipoprotein [Pseudomonas aeruginosa]